MAPPVERLALSPDEAAAALGCSRDFFDRLIGHEIRFIRRGRRKFFPVSELNRWLASEASLALGDDCDQMAA
ncbi:MAG TPA: helix-turn-helix domain-containing protein [Gaiellaceae bacterium]|nr:helix-turn-helix domain-containing protein [Gaiellaceae bacterium]